MGTNGYKWAPVGTSGYQWVPVGTRCIKKTKTKSAVLDTSLMSFFLLRNLSIGCLLCVWVCLSACFWSLALVGGLVSKEKRWRQNGAPWSDHSQFERSVVRTWSSSLTSLTFKKVQYSFDFEKLCEKIKEDLQMLHNDEWKLSKSKFIMYARGIAKG